MIYISLDHKLTGSDITAAYYFVLLEQRFKACAVTYASLKPCFEKMQSRFNADCRKWQAVNYQTEL